MQNRVLSFSLSLLSKQKQGISLRGGGETLGKLLMTVGVGVIERQRKEKRRWEVDYCMEYVLVS